MAHYIWVSYVSKMYEFLDTFIMLIKNNLKQVSFLHVYHHATISFVWWMIAHRAPGGDAYFSAALNSWVHVCMYSYYLLAVLVGKDEKRRKKYLWWGRYLTQMQMAQFALNLCQSVYTSMYSPYPKFISHILFVYMISLSRPLRTLLLHQARLARRQEGQGEEAEVRGRETEMCS